jgi:putative flippase GtrA
LALPLDSNVTESKTKAPPASLRSQLIRYLFVGGVAVLIDAGIYYLLVEFALCEPRWSKRVSFAVGALWGFGANKVFTFGRREFAWDEPILFTGVYLAGWALNSLLHDIVLTITGWRAFAFLVATGTSTCTNFIGQKWLVFRVRNRAKAK